MLEGTLKGILLSKLDDVFLGAGQARNQPAGRLVFIDYKECKGQCCQFIYIYHGSQLSYLNQGFIVGKMKASFNTRHVTSQRYGVVLEHENMGTVQSVGLVPFTGAVQALGAEKEAQ